MPQHEHDRHALSTVAGRVEDDEFVYRSKGKAALRIQEITTSAVIALRLAMPNHAVFPDAPVTEAIERALNILHGEFPALSGRDIKNLLKLAALVGESRKERKITLELITFVKRFKPTMDLDGDSI